MKLLHDIDSHWTIEFNNSNLNTLPDQMALKRDKQIAGRPLQGNSRGTISAGAPGLGKRK